MNGPHFLHIYSYVGIDHLHPAKTRPAADQPVAIVGTIPDDSWAVNVFGHQGGKHVTISRLHLRGKRWCATDRLPTRLTRSCRMFAQPFRTAKIGVISGLGAALCAREQGMVPQERTATEPVTAAHPFEAAISLDPSGEIRYVSI